MTQEELDALKPEQEFIHTKDETKFEDTGDFSSMDAEWERMQKESNPDPDPNTPESEPKEGEEEEEAPAVTPKEGEEEEEAPAVTPKEGEEEEEAPKASRIDDIELPEGASPKAGESFRLLKERAAAQIAEKDSEIQNLTARLQEVESSASQAMTPELEAELKELREFRARLDIEADPSFKEKYDSKAEGLREFVYAQLESAGVGKESIQKIKDLGGPEKVNLDGVFKSINNAPVQRLVESRVNDLLVLEFDRKREVDAAKGNVEKYLAEREEQYAKSVTEHREATTREVNTLLPKLTFLTPPPLKRGATPEEVAAHKSATEFAEEVKSHLAAATNDDSARMRAILITGMGQLLYTKRVLAATNEAHAKLKKEHEELVAKFDKVKKAGRSRIGTSTAPTTPTLKKTSADPHMSAAESLDLLRREQELASRNS